MLDSCILGFLDGKYLGRKRIWGPFLESQETFRAVKAIANSRTLLLQSCFIHISLIGTEVPVIQDVSGVYTSPFLDTDELIIKMALRARKVSRAFEKRAQDSGQWIDRVSRSRKSIRVPALQQECCNSELVRLFHLVQTIQHAFWCKRGKVTTTTIIKLVAVDYKSTG